MDSRLEAIINIMKNDILNYIINSYLYIILTLEHFNLNRIFYIILKI